MTLTDCIKRIERYLHSDDTQPRVVNVCAVKDLTHLKEFFHTADNIFLRAEMYSKDDENVSMDALFEAINHETGNVFLTEFPTSLKLLGEAEVKKQLSRLIHCTSTKCKMVIMCYDCEKFLETSDKRLERIIYLVDGDKPAKNVRLIFHAPDMPIPDATEAIIGINHLATAIEENEQEIFHVKTGKKKKAYPLSLYAITEESNPFDALCRLDAVTSTLNESYGTEEQWKEALTGVTQAKSWMVYLANIFGSTSNLELAASGWNGFDLKKKWTYFIALKLYGAKNNWCLNTAIKDATSEDNLVRQIFRSILSENCKAEDYWIKYDQRKLLLQSFGESLNEELDYCARVNSQGRNTLYYLTDANVVERNKIFETLNEYGKTFDKSELLMILGKVYPDLYAYLSPYPFKNQLLDDYFDSYKYEKVINFIFPEFETLVEEQAVKRDFFKILPPRSEKIEEIDKSDTQLYFMDAMGVEFLGYIMEKCRQMKLYANVTVCRCELPSLTFCNKEFVQCFKDAGCVLVSGEKGIKKIDDILHHGEENFDYEQTKLPLHLARELEIIEEVLKTIKTKLTQGICMKAVMIADHGASRLAVIKENTLDIDVNSKGTHGGRVCEYNEEVSHIPAATRVDDFYVLANYNRFKGGRAASVETHGGATLEEVAVPIIEITNATTDIEIIMMTPAITVSFRKKAEIQIFSKTKISNVSVCIAGQYYDAEPMEDNKFLIKTPDIKKQGKYKVDVYSNYNLVASGLMFEVKKESSVEKDLL
ncbi:MAG: BREX-4 system phosphatase PglZ [Clostridia bacterium]|nr:BREX-4 system phosphatase PglZ [Clostridia bacterium]